MKLIGITQRLFKSNFGELRTQTDVRLLNFVTECGYIPILIPYFNKNRQSYKKLNIWLNKINLSGIILSGGEDVGKFLLRDKSENLIISYSRKKKIPIYGICRGMQIIGQYFKSKLIPVKRHVKKIHLIYFKKEKKLVNSFHNFSLKNCPKNFQVEFKAYDGTIESIVSKDKKIYACMWHPERYKKFREFDIKNFKRLFR